MSADLSDDLLTLSTAFDSLAAPINRRLKTAHLPCVDVGLLGMRASSLPLLRPGRLSANGSCRLVRAKDDWIAINLARTTDFDLLPAWTECDAPAASLAQDLTQIVAQSPAAHWVGRGILLGLAVTRLGETGSRPACRAIRLSPPAPPKARHHVIDLSSLWAGPLCGHLLHRLGAEVVKVESRSRPDGARMGSPDLYAELNDGKRLLDLDFRDPAAIARLRDLILSADVLIEASRPRALKQLGLDAETLMPLAPGLTWVSITAYGRHGEAGERIGYGDDTAVAGGLVATDPDGGPRFIADAVADPLTGIHAAGQVTEVLESGSGLLLEIAMSGVAAQASANLRVDQAA